MASSEFGILVAFARQYNLWGRMPLTPLDYMLSIMRDPGATRHERLEAAGKAAPYCHPKLASVALEHGGKVGVIVNIVGDDAGLL